MQSEFYQEPAKRLPVYGHYDVVVVGGGCAGFAACVAAARLGASTLVIERFPYFGGTATASLMCNIVGTRNQVPPNDLQVMKGIGEELVLGLYGLGAAQKTATAYESVERSNTKGDLSYTYSYDPERFKWLSLQMVRQSGCDILFHTWFADVIMEGDRVKGIIIENKSGRQAVCAKVVVDASGDADAAFKAGVPFRQIVRNESRRLADTLMYRMDGFPKDGKARGCAFEDTIVTWGPTPEYSNAADARELTKLEIEARSAVYEHLDKLKKNYPDLESVKLIETGPLLGIRQTRLIEGDYTLTGDDVLKGRKFEDSVAMGANPVIEYYGHRHFLEHEGYEIPYRCLLPKNAEGLLVAGRCISSDQVAYESWRAMGSIFPLGEAAGTAAAVAARSGCTPRAVDIAEVQSRLIRQGAEIGQNAANSIHRG